MGEDETQFPYGDNDLTCFRESHTALHPPASAGLTPAILSWNPNHGGWRVCGDIGEEGRYSGRAVVVGGQIKEVRIRQYGLPKRDTTG